MPSAHFLLCDPAGGHHQQVHGVPVSPMWAPQGRLLPHAARQRCAQAQEQGGPRNALQVWLAVGGLVQCAAGVEGWCNALQVGCLVTACFVVLKGAKDVQCKVHKTCWRCGLVQGGTASAVWSRVALQLWLGVGRPVRCKAVTAVAFGFCLLLYPQESEPCARPAHDGVEYTLALWDTKD
eukprot:1150391-Pelagomonas_calceolata.AAC.4